MRRTPSANRRFSCTNRSIGGLARRVNRPECDRVTRALNCDEDKRCGTVESRILPTSAMVRSSLLSLAPHYLLTSSDLSIATLAFDGDAPSLAGRAAHHFLAGNARAR